MSRRKNDNEDWVIIAGIVAVVITGLSVIRKFTDSSDRIDAIGAVASIVSYLTVIYFSRKAMRYAEIQADAAKAQAAASVLERRAAVADACYRLALKAYQEGPSLPREDIRRFRAVTLTQAAWLFSSDVQIVLQRLVDQADAMVCAEPPLDTGAPDKKSDSKAKEAFAYFTEQAKIDLDEAFKPYQDLLQDHPELN